MSARGRPTAIDYEPEGDEDKAEGLAGDDGAFGRVGAGFDGKYKGGPGESDGPEGDDAHDVDESEDGCEAFHFRGLMVIVVRHGGAGQYSTN